MSSDSSDWKWKSIVAGVVILIISILIFIIKIQYDMTQRLQTIQKSVVETKDLGDGLVRAQGSYITKTQLEALIKDHDINLQKIKDDMASLGAKPVALNEVQVVTPGLHAVGVGSNLPPLPRPGPTVVTICDPANPTKCLNPDKWGYLNTEQQLKLDEPFDSKTNIPFGIIGFSAADEKPWTVNIFKRIYSADTVLGQDEAGRHYAYSKFFIEVNGKKTAVPLTAKISEIAPEASFRFNPQIYLSVDGGAIVNPTAHAEVMPSIGVSLFSYGQTKASPEWSFATIGVGYASQNRAGALTLAPINYNLGRPNILIRNLHVGPAVSLDTDGHFGLYLGARVGL